MLGFLAALLRFYGSSNSIPIPVWRQRLSWLISALSGTVEIEIELAKLNELTSKMHASFASPSSKRCVGGRASGVGWVAIRFQQTVGSP